LPQESFESTKPSGKTGPSSKKLKSIFKWSHGGIAFKGKSEGVGNDYDGVDVDDDDDDDCFTKCFVVLFIL